MASWYSSMINGASEVSSGRPATAILLILQSRIFKKPMWSRIYSADGIAESRVETASHTSDRSSITAKAGSADCETYENHSSDKLFLPDHQLRTYLGTDS